MDASMSDGKRATPRKDLRPVSFLLSEIEDEDLAARDPFDAQHGLAGDRDAIALGDRLAIDPHAAPRDLHPDAAAGTDRELGVLPGIEQPGMDDRVGRDRDAAISPIRRC